MLVELSVNSQKVKEHNQVAKENKEKFPNLGSEEVEALEDVFYPYAKMLDSSYLDKYIKIQEDYKNREEFRGVYVVVADSNHLIAEFIDYREVANLQSPIYNQGCGVADNASQVLDFYEELCRKHAEYAEGKDFVILMTPVFREEPEEQGGTWREGGEYLGKFQPQHEYLQDEEGIDFVWVFNIVEVEKQ